MSAKKPSQPGKNRLVEADEDLAAVDSFTQRARELAGAWSDLDWEEVSAALDRIRHQSIPAPPIDDL